MKTDGEPTVKKHTIPPVYDSRSRILILGSFPSEASRRAGFYYAHPQNRFWRMISALCGCEGPFGADAEHKRAMLLEARVALWDVAAECEVTGSSDASLRRVTPNGIPALLAETEIRQVFLNGSVAGRLYEKLIAPSCNVPYTVLPSTSPANAAWSFERLCEAWRDAGVGTSGI